MSRMSFVTNLPTFIYHEKIIYNFFCFITFVFSFGGLKLRCKEDFYFCPSQIRYIFSGCRSPYSW